MDPIGTIPPVAIPTIPAPAPSANAVILPALGQDAQASTDDTEQKSFDPQAAEQKRLEAVQQSANSVANLYVVGDKKFTIYKDATGQYITRFTSLRDGKVTYIPEPSLVRTTAPSAGMALNIKA